jgi:hypothetical protein
MHFGELECNTFDLYTTLCSLSYKGDIRMKFKMENPNKVSNIVKGSLDGLNELYIPRLKMLEEIGIVTFTEDQTKFKVILPYNSSYDYIDKS